MAQYIKQGSIFGRIGSGIGKGIAEQLPKEIENQRLRAGLNDVAKQADQGNLSPASFLAKVAGTYGVTPQIVQSFTELSKLQNQRNAFQNSANGGRLPPGTDQGPGFKASPDMAGVQTANILDQAANAGMPMQTSLNPQAIAPSPTGVQPPSPNLQKTPNVGRKEDIPQVAPGNPLNQQNLPRNAWTPQERNAVISDYINQGFLPDQAQQLASDDESRYLGQPEVYRERQAEIKAAKQEARNALTRHLETKLQKTGENVFKDIEGPMLLNAERGMIRDLIVNPKSDIDNVANDWSERLYRTAIAKGKLRTMGQTTGIENFLKGNQSINKLKEYQDIFKKSGNLEEFQNILVGPDFGMSTQAAASVAYPPSKKVADYFKNVKTDKFRGSNDQKARKAAIEIGKNIQPDDSILSIARKLSEIDPYFDQKTFFEQISEDKDELGLNERQRLELAEQPTNFLPNWADLLFLPIFRR